MGRIGRLLLVIVLGVLPVAVFVWKMLLPGLGDFVAASLPVKVAYIGCAVSSFFMAPLGLFFAMTNKAAAPAKAKPSKSKNEVEELNTMDQLPAESMADDFGDSQFGDSEFGDSSLIDDSEFGDSEFGDSEVADAGFDDDDFGDDNFDAFDDDDDEFA